MNLGLVGEIFRACIWSTKIQNQGPICGLLFLGFIRLCEGSNSALHQGILHWDLDPFLERLPETSWEVPESPVWFASMGP